MIDIIFASANKHKQEEVQQILGEKFRVISLRELNYNKEIIENANTLEGNAQIKARTIYKEFGKMCFADDTGLEVFALGGEPGVYSARYAGETCSSTDNMEKLLSKLKTEDNRSAQFRTSICLIREGVEYFFDGIVKGEIIKNTAGYKGFEYDPIFKPLGFDKTFAQMPEDLKNEISHRGISVRKLAKFLNEIY